MEAGASDEGGDQIQVGHIQGSKAIAIGRGATAIYQGLSIEEVTDLVVQLKHKDQPKVWDGRYPYLGLTSFQESDAEFFFGRESLVADLLARVQKANFIVIAGPSGSGKSSVARAGLFHALRDGRIERSDTWLLATMLPKGNPIEQLAEAVARLAKSPAASDYLKQEGPTNPQALARQLETLLSDDPRQRCVLLVDQFEETFTQTKDEEVRIAFINLLTTAASTDKGRIIIVLSLRADFVSHCARYPQLRTLMSQQFQLVGAMEPEDLAKAITLPALEVGAAIDPALVSRIMADMKGEPGALPLMSFALRDLFEAEKSEKGQPMDMTLPEYLQRGGIESALERHANQVFDHFTAEQKTLAPNIFSKLIEVGQGRVDTRRTAVFSELVPKGIDETAVAEIVNQLAQEGVRLITTGGSEGDEETATATHALTTVTIAHEKLIDAWPWLRQLVDENREIIRMQNQINNDAQAWQQMKRDDGMLYRGVRLIQAMELVDSGSLKLTELSAVFLAASRELAEREAREAEARRQRELEQERVLATEQRQRADAEALSARRLRLMLAVSMVLIVVLTIISVALIRPIFLEWQAKREARTELARVEGGTAVIGTNNEGKAEPDEQPEWHPNLPTFYIEKYEVSNRQYRLCVEFGNCSTPNDPTLLYNDAVLEHPVVNLTAVQAATYCQWIDRRLPTELEWEYAARGNEGRDWPWGNTSPTGKEGCQTIAETTFPVQANMSERTPEGVHNLCGNVWEWTASYYIRDSYEREEQSNWDGKVNTLRNEPLVIRGSSIYSAVPRITFRLNASPYWPSDDYGVRCVEMR